MKDSKTFSLANNLYFNGVEDHLNKKKVKCVCVSIQNVIFLRNILCIKYKITNIFKTRAE